MKCTCYLHGHGNCGGDEVLAELRIKWAITVPRVVIEDEASNKIIR